jgi:chorismate mutase
MEDADQSRRFLEMARELEADGGLSPTEAEGAFDRLFKAAVPKKKAAEAEPGGQSVDPKPDR